MLSGPEREMIMVRMEQVMTMQFMNLSFILLLQKQNWSQSHFHFGTSISFLFSSGIYKILPRAFGDDADNKLAFQLMVCDANAKGAKAERANV